MKKVFYLFVLTLALSSCGPDFILDQQQEISSGVWKYDDIKSFDVHIDDIDSKYNLQLLITYSKEYSYENVYMKIITKFPVKENREEQITISLADKNGQWEGKCNSSSCTAKVFLLDEFKFAEKGNYGFSFEQFTRDSELIGIEKLQLELFPIKE